MELKTNCAIHNKFEIEVTDAKTGKVKQKETAYNIVLDSMWSKLCNGLPYFGGIVFGAGEGVPSPTRTTLFERLGTKGATTVETVKELPISKWKKKIVLNPEEYVGQRITEFGIGDSSFGSSIVTHAILKDSEGNPISILKTDTDVITIFATVYVTLSINDENMRLTGLHNDSNHLLNYLVGGGSAPTGSFSLNEIHEPYAKLGTTGTVNWTADVSKRQRKTGVMRFGIITGNGYAGFLEFSNLFVLDLGQSSFFSGQPYTNVPLGIGDDLEKEWVLPSNNIRKSSIKIYKDGLLQSGFLTKEYNEYPVRMNEKYSGSIGSSNSVTISDKSKVMAVATRNSPFILTFERINGAWMRRGNPDVLPTGTAYKVAMSLDGAVLAVAHSTTPCISTYDWIQGAWKKRPNPTILPVAEAKDVALSSDGRVMAVRHLGTSKIITYDWDGTAWNARPAPQSLPKNTGLDLAMSSNGNVLAVRDGDPPYIATYEWDGENWIKRPSPVDPPGLNSSDMVLSADGNTLISEEYYAPYLYIYDWIGGAWVRRVSETIVPISKPSALTANRDCTVIAFGHEASPFLTVYDWQENTWKMRTTPKSVPGKFTSDIAISDDGAFAATAHGDLPYLAMYEYIRSTKIKFVNPPGLNEVITTDYVVEGIHKTDQYVVDVSFAIQFGEGV